MEVTKELLKDVLAKLVKESDFKGYSFTINKNLLSLNDSGINNPNYTDAVVEDDMPWNVHLHVNDGNLAMIATFEVEVRNTMSDAEFESFVRRKALRLIQKKGEK